jgi:hypothetical protein
MVVSERKHRQAMETLQERNMKSSMAFLGMTALAEHLLKRIDVQAGIIEDEDGKHGKPTLEEIVEWHERLSRFKEMGGYKG